MKQYAEIMATYSKKMQNQAEGLLYFHLPLYAFMDSPAVFSGIGGMCSPPYVNARIFFCCINSFRYYRGGNWLFRKSPLSDTDGIKSFRFRYSIYPYTQTNNRSAGEYNVFSGRFAIQTSRLYGYSFSIFFLTRRNFLSISAICMAYDLSFSWIFSYSSALILLFL